MGNGQRTHDPHEQYRDQVKQDKANSMNPAQGAAQSNTPEQAAQPELETANAGKGGNPTTGKGSVEQDDEDVGGDQDRTPEPEITPVVDEKSE
jgi:hypothetical protein